MRKRLIFASLLCCVFLALPCKTPISDRIRFAATLENFMPTIFDHVDELRFSFEPIINRYFSSSTCALLLDHQVVFVGSFKALVTQKIALPKATIFRDLSRQQPVYTLGIHVYDHQTQRRYSWATDQGVILSNTQTNKLKLLYTGSLEASVCLEVENSVSCITKRRQ